MKVLMVNKLYYPVIGGVENHVRDLATSFSSISKDVDVRVLVANTSRKTVQEEIDGIKVTKVADIATIQSAPIAPTFPIWLRRLKSDIYHFHFPYPIGELSYLLARPPGKLVVTYHSDIIRQRFLLSLYKPFLRLFLKKADCILASSPNLIRHSPFLSEFRDKCRVAHFGIELSRFKMSEQIKDKVKKIKEKYPSKIVLFVGRLIYYKGVNYLMEAMTDIDAHLIIVGEGPLENELKQLASDLGISNKIDFAGWVDDQDLPSYYHACDVFVLPSVARSEAFGLVQLEAQACEKPVVSTDLTTGVPYANLDQITGLVVQPESKDSLSMAINKLLQDENLRREYGKNGKKRVEKEFSKEAMAKRVLQIYSEILS
jgi:rhamnosyl/mannosyltransferase